LANNRRFSEKSNDFQTCFLSIVRNFELPLMMEAEKVSETVFTAQG
jgi:hypothetical protein